ncbi:hypothetical protein FA15DRAFT_701078 [Coprinopsis marcescibilis]|uniref:DUF1793-domain-containing protein n=1 Tax=Coprinopsis marcescibilis TaxID=230819 RepID=A0A5C3L5V6_COPMA|nr:hypothetical protein FA15DRAFT_701078 [Coprinopsis marcescibilis]
MVFGFLLRESQIYFAFCCFWLLPLFIGAGVSAQAVLSTLPRNVPLINRSPYFNAWTAAPEGGEHPTPAGANVTTWSWRDLDWNGLIRVDGEVWQWMGNTTGFRPATTVASYLTATRTMYTMEAGQVAFNVSYLSPVEARDIVKFSIPFGYVYVDVWSKDGVAHSVQLYSEVGPPLTTIRNDTMEWDTVQTSTSVYHELQRRLQSSSERFNMVENGVLYSAMARSNNPTWQSGPIVDVRSGFVDEGVLPNTEDEVFRAAMAADYPIFGLAADLGGVQTTSNRVVWAVGHVRLELMSGYSGTTGRTERRTSYFWSEYPNIGAVIDAFLADFPAALGRAEELDGKIMEDARGVSQEYADLVALSLRQTVGSIEVTLPRLGPFDEGGWNISDVQAFMRDTGVSSRANPVETMYAAMPAFVYLNPTLLQLLLKPLLAFQASEEYRNGYASPDLGDDYTRATGNDTNTERLGVESCGSMLIMSYVSAKQTNDFTLLNRYSGLFKKWADFLVGTTFNANNQISTDGISEDGHANLALKGILGIYAMSKIQEIVDPAGASSAAAKEYLNQATAFARRWEDLAVSGGHISSVYGQPATWAMMYNYYPASLFAPDLFSRKALEDQGKFYLSQLDSAPDSNWGLPYDSLDSQLSKSHWTILTAATVPDPEIRNRLIQMVHRRTFWRGVAVPFATTWNLNTGAAIELGGRGSSAQGAMFALLAVNSVNTPGSNNRSGAGSNGKPSVAAIAGGAAGGIVALLLIAGIAFFFWRRRGGTGRPKSRYLVNKTPRTSFSGSVAAAPIPGFVNDTRTYVSPELQPTPFEFTPRPRPLDLDGTSPPHTASGGQPSPPLSKELLMAQRSRNTSRDGGLSYVATTPSVLSSGANYSGTGTGSGSVLSSSSNERQLQQQVEQLRREVGELRAERNQQVYRPSTPSEAPPPTYTA